MNYILAETIPQALDLLKGAAGRGRLIAGGTDVVVDLEAGKISADLLVDVTRIPGLSSIEVKEGRLSIGAAATLSEICRSSLVRAHAPQLAKAAGRVGSRQIGNVATLTGNVVSAQPAADAAMALATLNAVFDIQSPEGKRSLPMEQMYAGFGRSVVDSRREIVTRIHLPCLGPDEAGEFMRLELRSALALPMLNASVAVKIQKGAFVWARIAMGPVGVGPVRAKKAESWLTGREPSAAILRQAAALAAEEANPRSNPLRGTREYRLHTLPVLVRRGLESAVRQLGAGGD